MSEPGPGEFGLYEIALLCGGPERVAQTALLVLHERRRVRISRGTHRVQVVGRDPGDPVQDDDPVQAAVLAQIPSPGRLLGQVIAAAAAAPETSAVGEALREAGLVRGGRFRPTRRGRRVRRGLAAAPGPSAPERLAALGPAGVEDARMREILQSDDPKPMKLPHFRGRGHPESSDLSDTQYGGSGAGGMN